MEDSEWIILIACVCGLAVSFATMIVAVIRLRRSPEDPLVRFTYGWLGAFALSSVPLCGVGIVWVLGDHAGTSGWATGGLVASNMLTQPIGLLFFWTGAFKLTLGLGGHVGVGFHRASAEELIRFSAQERSEFARYCVLQGAMGLVIGGAISVGCAWPLVMTMLE